MLNGYKVSDVDLHVVEPGDLWLKRIDPAFRDLAPRPVNVFDDANASYPRMMVAGTVVNKTAGNNRLSPLLVRQQRENMNRWYGDLIKMGWTPQAQILGMDRAGIDVGFLFGSLGINVLCNDEVMPDLAVAIARAYNDWLGDFTSHNRDRLKHVAVMPMQDPQGAVEEVRRCAKSYKTCGVIARGEPHNGRTIDDPAYDVLWSELERLNLALGIHITSGSILPTLGAHRFKTRFQSHTVSHPMEQMASMVALIGSGVLERHPKLRVAFLESGGGWLPYMLWRLDEQYEQQTFEAPHLKMKPSDYFKRQCWISVESDEPNIKAVAEAVGEDRLVISSDFPHADHEPGGLKRFADRGDLSDSLKRKTLWDNTMRFYGLT